MREENVKRIGKGQTIQGLGLWLGAWPLALVTRTAMDVISKAQS